MHTSGYKLLPIDVLDRAAYIYAMHMCGKDVKQHEWDFQNKVYNEANDKEVVYINKAIEYYKTIIK